jgi:hypothetical protein
VVAFEEGSLMPFILPLVPSVPLYTVTLVGIDDRTYNFRLRWNSQANGRQGAWCMDVYEVDNTPIAVGIKIVLGVYLGRTSTHPLFRNGVFIARDTSGQSREATLHDLGTRVVVEYFTAREIENIAGALTSAETSP